VEGDNSDGDNSDGDNSDGDNSGLKMCPKVLFLFRYKSVPSCRLEQATKPDGFKCVQVCRRLELSSSDFDVVCLLWDTFTPLIIFHLTVRYPDLLAPVLGLGLV
jgi:hypothetical protein